MLRNQLKLLQIKSLMQALIVFLSIFLVQIVSMALWMGLSSLLSYLPQRSVMLQQISILSSFFMILWCGYLYQQSNFRIRPFPYRQVFSGKMLGSTAMLAMGGCTILIYLLKGLSQAFPTFFAQYNSIMEQFNAGGRGWMYLYALLFGPIAEELIFRGAILDRLYLGFPFWAANLLQAALFGLYHMNLIQGLYAFGWGILLGLVRQTAGSVLLSMEAHILFNVTNYLLGWLLPKGTTSSVLLYAGTLLVGIIFFGTGLWYTIREGKKKDAREEADTNQVYKKGI